MKFTQLPTDMAKTIQLNAGVLATEFTPSTGVIAGIMGATSGGVNFTAAPEYIDFGEDIDNCPKNTKEMKVLDTWTATMSGTFVTVTPTLAKLLAAAADTDTLDTTKIVPRADILQTDFSDIWWVGDYSDKTGATNGGFIAIHLLNSLSTGGFQIQSEDKSKGQFEFEFTGHYSIADMTTVPFELYVKAGTAEPTPTP